MILPGLPFGLAKGKKPLEFVGGKSVSLLGSKTVSLTGLSGGIASAPDSGDFVLIGLKVSQAGDTFSAVTSGYSRLADNGSAGPSFALFSKRLASAETSFVFTSEFDTVACVYVWRNTSETQPIDASVVSARGSSSSPNPPSITTVTPSAVVVSFALRASNSITSAPSGMENFITGSGSGAASILRPSVGSYDPGAFTASASGIWAALTIALRPK